MRRKCLGGCGRLVDVEARMGRCTACRGVRLRVIDADPRRRARKAELYDPFHVRERALWVPFVDAGDVPCWRCGLLLVDRDEHGHVIFDLGHREGAPSLPEHLKCNRGAPD